MHENMMSLGIGLVLGVGSLFLILELLPMILLLGGGYLIVKSITGGDTNNAK